MQCLFLCRVGTPVPAMGISMNKFMFACQNACPSNVKASSLEPEPDWNQNLKLSQRWQQQLSNFQLTTSDEPDDLDAKCKI